MTARRPIPRPLCPLRPAWVAALGVVVASRVQAQAIAERGGASPETVLGLGMLLAAALALLALRQFRDGPWLWRAGFPAALLVAAIAAILHGLGAQPAPQWSLWRTVGLVALGVALLCAYLLLRAAASRRPAAGGGVEAWLAPSTTQNLSLPAGDELGEATLRFRAIHDAAAEAIVTLDVQGRILSANPATEMLFGYRLESLRQKRMQDLVNSREPPGEEHAAVPPTLQGRPLEVEGKRRDGSTFAAEMVSSRVETREGLNFIVLLRDISERRAAEDRLRRSNDLFRAILEGTRESLFLMDREGQLLAINTTAAERLGKRPEEMIGKSVFTLFPEEVRAQRRALFFDVIDSGKPASMEDARDGHHFAIHFYPILDDAAKVNAVSVFAQEITERKLAEEQLRNSEARYRLLLDNMQVGYMVTRLSDGRIIGANPALARIFGYSQASEVIGRQTSEFYADPEERTRLVQALSQQGFLMSYPVLSRRQDGGLRNLECRLRVVAENAELPARIEALIMDVTEAREAENQLQEASQRLKDMTDELPCVVFQFRSDREARGQFTFISKHIEQIDGISPQAALADAKSLIAIMHPDDRAQHIAALKLAARKLSPWASDFRVRANDGSMRWLHAAAVLHEEPSGSIVWNGYWLDVTDRKAAEQEVIESRNLLQGILDGTRETLVLVSRQGIILAANRTAALRVGFREGRELVGRHAFSLFSAAVAAKRKAHFDLALTSNQAQYFEDEREGRHYQVSLFPLHDAQGVPGNIVWFGQDISSRKRAEDELRESERKYRAVFDRLQVGYFRVGFEGHIQTVNPAAAALLGYASVDDLAGRDVADIYFDLAEREALKNELAARHKTANYPMRLRRRDGSALEILANSELQFDPEGKPAFIETSIQDVTVLRELEARLRESEARFRLQLQNLPIEICICDVTGQVLYANDQYLRTIGYTGSDAPTLSDWWNLCVKNPEARSALARRWSAATRAAEGSAMAASMPEAHLHCKDGVERVYDIVARRIGEEYLVVFSNVTAREEATRAMQNAKEAAEHAALAKTQFLATMSHEIRTPLNGIIGMTELAIATAADEEQRRYLAIVRSSADALLGMLNDVLDFTKIEAGRLVPERIAFDLRENVGEVLALMRPQAEKKGLLLAAHIDAAIPPSISSDPLRLRQIITNYLSNAIKFTETGRIDLSIELEARSGTHCELHLRVRDTGIGIPADRLNSIFAAFQQADGSITRRYGGTGLGLAICARLAEMLGGQVWAESEVGRGSTFHCIVSVEAVD